MLDLWIYDVIDLQSLCARSFRITEDMQLRDVETLDELPCLFKQLVGLSPCADYDIDTNEGMGHDRLDPFYFVSEQGRIVPATHQFQDAVTATLQRNVEMGRKAFAARHEVDRFVCDQVRLDGRDPIAGDPFYLIQGTNQIDEMLIGGFAEVSDVDSCQHNLFTPVCRYLACLLYQTGYRTVSASATGKGNGTLGTEIVTPVLYFEEMTGTVVRRTGGRKGTDVLTGRSDDSSWTRFV